MQKSVKILGVITFIISLLLLAWGYIPLPTEQEYLHLPGVGHQSLDWTTIIRRGDAGDLKLVISSPELMSGGNAESSTGTRILDQVRQALIEDRDNITAQVRIELPDARINPGPELTQPLQIGEDLKVNFQITPIETGMLNGEVWLYLYPAKPIQGDSRQDPVSILDFSLRATSLFGLTGQQARIFGVLGMGLVILLWIVGNGNINIRGK